MASIDLSNLFGILQALVTGELGIGTPAVSTQAVTIKGTTSDSTAFAVTVTDSSGTNLVRVRNNGALSATGQVTGGSFASVTGNPATMTGMTWNGALKTVAYTVTLADSGKYFHNAGDATVAPGTVFTLPTLAGGSYTMYTFTNYTAGGLRLRAGGTNVIQFPGSASTAGGTQTTTTIGGSVTLYGNTDNNTWSVLGGVGGTWVAA